MSHSDNFDNFFSQELELTILGEIIIFFDELKARLTEIDTDDFCYKENMALFVELVNAYAKNPDVDQTIIMSMLTKASFQTLKDAVGMAYTSANFNAQLARLKELASNRRIKKRVQELSAGSVVVTTNDLIKIAEEEKSGILSSSLKSKSTLMLDNFITSIGVDSPKIKTGFTEIDKTIGGGFRIPSVSIIGAYPSVGKTAFALNICTKQDIPVVFFSLEMSASMIYERVISSTERIEYNKFSTQKLNPNEIKAAKESGGQIKSKHFYVFDDIYDIERQSSVIANIKPKLVVVDYIQKVVTHKKIDSRRNEIDYISGMYKQIAKNNNCHIILLSQISRMDRNNPTMGSLKESGALEADGDYVFILHRPYVLNKNGNEASPTEAYILVDKNKFGNTGKMNLYFEGQYQRFREIDRNFTKYGSQNRSKTNINDDDCPFET